jgi:hypothetical protein
MERAKTIEPFPALSTDLGNRKGRFPHSLGPDGYGGLNLLFKKLSRKEPSPSITTPAPSGSFFDWKRLRGTLFQHEMSLKVGFDSNAR